MSGIYGRLGDLGSIDEKFDVAISTAGANMLDDIVVENVQTAEKCVQYLKENKISVGKFLCLDKA